MIDTNELIVLIAELGGSATLDEIANKYAVSHKMAVFSEHKTVFLKILKESSGLVRYDIETGVWQLSNSDNDTPKPGITEKKEEFRKAAYEWIEKHKDDVLLLNKPAAERQFIVTEGLAKILPKVNNGGESGYYATYEINITSNSAVMKIRFTTDNKIPRNYIKLYKDSLLNEINKEYRNNQQDNEKKQYYSTKIKSLKLTENTTLEDLYKMLDDAFEESKKWKKE